MGISHPFPAQVHAAPAEAAGAPAFGPLCGALGRDVGRALRRGGAEAACAVLRAETHRLLAKTGNGAATGRLRWLGRDDAGAATGGDDVYDGEFRDGCLWLYAPSGPLALWVPAEAVAV